MQTKLLLCLIITTLLSGLKAQELEVNGFRFGDSWEHCMNVIRENYPTSFNINPSGKTMSFSVGLLPPFTETTISFQQNKISKMFSARSLVVSYFDRSVAEIQRRHQSNVNTISRAFIQCYSILESKYGTPIQVTEVPEATWNIDNVIISLSANEQVNEFGCACGISLTYEKGVITVPNNTPKTESDSYVASGSGIILTTNGIIATNHHVIEGASVIDIQLTRNGEVKTYKSKILVDDKTNDLALLKIEDDAFKNFSSIPYAFKTSVCDVGTAVFAMGYPMSAYLGEEVKITDGLISSKTGYQGDAVTYQISAPIQHGNSGGPLFDKQGNLVGITNAGVSEADNVGYAIKTSYLKNLIDVSPIPVNISNINKISNLSFTEKIKALSSFVVYIKIK